MGKGVYDHEIIDHPYDTTGDAWHKGPVPEAHRRKKVIVTTPYGDVQGEVAWWPEDKAFQYTVCNDNPDGQEPLKIRGSFVRFSNSYRFINLRPIGNSQVQRLDEVRYHGDRLKEGPGGSYYKDWNNSDLTPAVRRTLRELCEDVVLLLSDLPEIHTHAMRHHWYTEYHRAHREEQEVLRQLAQVQVRRGTASKELTALGVPLVDNQTQQEV